MSSRLGARTWGRRQRACPAPRPRGGSCAAAVSAARPAPAWEAGAAAAPAGRARRRQRRRRGRGGRPRRRRSGAGRTWRPETGGCGSQQVADGFYRVTMWWGTTFSRLLLEIPPCYPAARPILTDLEPHNLKEAGGGTAKSNQSQQNLFPSLQCHPVLICRVASTHVRLGSCRSMKYGSANCKLQSRSNPTL